MERESSPRSSSSSPPENLVESFIGEFVSLISNDDKRYEGVICLLNLQDSTLRLQNVRCYGREGKNSNEQRGVQLLNEVYYYMLFSGSGIKLSVLVLEGRNSRRHSEVVACNQLDGPIHFRFKEIKDLEIIFLWKPIYEEEETTRESDDFPPLNRSHLGHRQGGV